ncbi:G-protein beta WD-40 repeats containing protein [Reticulomyxa filosa]|uniref:G-protein beta WD-40 repeats containing protein n=1 Tax=Reticulomyxa filosa TaxID=46433 RepID=X6LTT5_RETFI|nr:G-protein beta WD-40 repeats containing protein [Reticulomyxa filosa]|eukprot:ETO04527.1 G-protein beta WD-40 repeats containing protein [Reticulomyxa filosa]
MPGYEVINLINDFCSFILFAIKFVERINYYLLKIKIIITHIFFIFQLYKYKTSYSIIFFFLIIEKEAYQELFIDYLSSDDGQFICSGSIDNTIHVWDIENNKQIQSFNGNSNVYCVKFSQYHYYNNHRSVICSSLHNETIHFWDFKDNQQLKTLNKHTGWISGIEFSSFNCGRYLCSGSEDKTIRLWEINYYIFLMVIRKVFGVLIQNNNNNNNIGDNKKDNGIKCIKFISLKKKKDNNDNCGIYLCYGSYNGSIHIWG